MRSLLAGAAAAALLLLLVPTAAEAVDGVVVDGSEVTAEESDDGSIVAEVVLVNTTPKDVELVSSVDVSDGCTVDLTVTRLPALRSTTVPMELDEGCFEGAHAVRLDLDGAEGALPRLRVDEPEGEGASTWEPMRDAAIAALVLALVVAASGEVSRRKVAARTRQADGAPDPEQARYDEIQAIVGQKTDELGLPRFAWVPLPDRPEFGLGSEIDGLSAGWSFQDSWVSNFTVATTAFIALASSADVFTALLGEEPEGTLGVIAVAGLLSAAVVAVANTLVKVIGRTTATVTVGGLLLSTGMVTFGAVFQALTVGLSAVDVVGGVSELLTWVLMLAAAGSLVAYAIRTLHSALDRGPLRATPPDLPADALDRWQAASEWQRALVAREIRAHFAGWITEGTGTGRSAAPDVGSFPGLAAGELRDLGRAALL